MSERSKCLFYLPFVNVLSYLATSSLLKLGYLFALSLVSTPPNSGHSQILTAFTSPGSLGSPGSLSKNALKAPNNSLGCKRKEL